MQQVLVIQRDPPKFLDVKVLLAHQAEHIVLAFVGIIQMEKHVPLLVVKLNNIT